MVRLRIDSRGGTLLIEAFRRDEQTVIINFPKIVTVKGLSELTSSALVDVLRGEIPLIFGDLTETVDAFSVSINLSILALFVNDAEHIYKAVEIDLFLRSFTKQNDSPFKVRERHSNQ